jgi:protein TonB
VRMSRPAVCAGALSTAAHLAVLAWLVATPPWPARPGRSEVVLLPVSVLATGSGGRAGDPQAASAASVPADPPGRSGAPADVEAPPRVAAAAGPRGRSVTRRVPREDPTGFAVYRTSARRQFALRGEASTPSAGAVAAEAPTGRDDGARASGAGGASRGGDAPRGGAGVRYGINPKPPYPEAARSAGIEGTVMLRVLVRSDGGVGVVEVSASSGSATLDESARRTVRERWRFVPARVDGAPIDTWVRVPIQFTRGGG